MTFVRDIEFSGADSPSLSIAPSEAQQLSAQADKTNRCMSDGEREAAIALAGSLVELHMAEAGRARARVEAAKARMYVLIAGRSAQQISKLEAERGLA